MTTQAPRRGRPPKKPEDVLIGRSIRLSADHWKKIDAAGMESFRALLDHWKIQGTLRVPRS